ncbi:hypothetical protein EV702DRAFT_692313 [Suillus placidus]|uniref:Uncharacterized protein n=1 Tax=Suillus placidus TaxID=48579 RepID=A0A9P7A454_9AGAM|nr:hypothetical protein EV702DRAFT_692313 [Suillus placidus]
MSFNNANTLSFDKPSTLEIPGFFNGGTIWVASPDDCTSPGNSSRSAGFLELPPQPTSEPLLDLDAFSTLVSTFDGCITRAMCDREVQQHTLPIDSYTNSNTVVQVMEMPIQAELTPLYASGSTDGVYEDSGSDLSEISQSPLLLDSRDTGLSIHLNFKKPVDDLEQDLQSAIIPTETATDVPQRLYQPRGETEREKYVYTAVLSSPILFYAEKPSELGIALEEILKKNSRRLSDRDDLVFEGGGRSISVRIEWPGYPPWNCQLLTRDYRKTPGPITKAKLAKSLATCIRRFIQVRLHVSLSSFPSMFFFLQKMATHGMEAQSDPMWRISPRHITFEDLTLVSLNHVSQGSWQPQLRLRRQMRGASSRA